MKVWKTCLYNYELETKSEGLIIAYKHLHEEAWWHHDSLIKGTPWADGKSKAAPGSTENVISGKSDLPRSNLDSQARAFCLFIFNQHLIAFKANLFSQYAAFQDGVLGVS